MQCPEFRQSVDAFIDEELMPEEADAMRAHIASCRQCADEHKTLVDLSRRLKTSFDLSPAPDVLKARIRSQLATPGVFERAVETRRQPWARMIAAGLMIAALSGLATLALARRSGLARPIEEQVLSSHIRSLMPGHLTDIASTDLHNVKPWFNGRVDLSPAVPRLDSIGFPLVGGRLDYVAGRVVAAVAYTRRQHIINVFSWPVEESGAQAPVVSTEKGYHLIRWRDGGVEFWVASDLSVPELTQFVDLFRKSGVSPANSLESGNK